MGKKITDIEVIKAIKSGKDNKVLNYLYNTIQPKVTSYIRSNNGDTDEANDIFQDAVMIFYKHVKTDKYDEKKDIAGFIYSVSRNLWINRVKQINRMVNDGEGEIEKMSEGNILDDLISDERKNAVMDILGRIGERCKELLIYSIFYRYSMKEICEVMGFSTENAAKTRNYKCKQKLVEIVKNDPSVQFMLKG